jgi:heme-degrading monooxygenase HmoA
MIVFVNNFALKGPAAEFERVFTETSDFLRVQPGFLSHRLVRSAKDPQHYLNIALWESEAALRAASGLAEFADHAHRLREVASTDPQFYQPVMERHGETADHQLLPLAR